MPRISPVKRLEAPAAINPGAPRRRHRPPPPPPPPRLWNAHKRIETGRTQSLQGWRPKALVESNKWREMVTPDIVEYIDKANPSPEDRYRIVRSPHWFFSRPRNVPVEFRKQVYFPKFIVTLYRTPHLPPKYASFDVPLWFNKLDLRSYLSSVYNVEVLHIRSTVVQQKIVRDRESAGRGVSNAGYGRLKRPMSKKRMTVELVEPFVWPEEIKDLSSWENESFWTSHKEQIAFQRTLQPESILRPNEKHRKSIAEQAKELLEGKAQWKPTWQSIPTEARVLEGQKPRPSSRISQLVPA